MAWLILCASRSYVRERNVAIFFAVGISAVTLLMATLAIVLEVDRGSLGFWLPAIVYLMLVPLAVLWSRADKRKEAATRPIRSREVRQSMDILKTSIAMGGASRLTGDDRLALLDEAAGYSLKMSGIVESLRQANAPGFDLARRAYFAAERSMYGMVQGSVSCTMPIPEMRATVDAMREASGELERAVGVAAALPTGPRDELRTILGEMRLLSAARDELKEEPSDLRVP